MKEEDCMKKALIIVLVSCLLLFSCKNKTTTPNSSLSSSSDISNGLNNNSSISQISDTTEQVSTYALTEHSDIFTNKTESTISQKYLQAMSNCGFDANMNLKKLEEITKSKKISDKYLYDYGLLYKATDLSGSSFAYGVLRDAVTYDEHYSNGKQTYSYSLYMSKSIENSYLPSGLTVASTFEEALNEFNVMEKYNRGKNNADRTIILNESNGEKVWIYFAGWHGKLTDNSLNNASVSISFSKEQGKYKLFGNLDFLNGVKVAEFNFTADSIEKQQTLTEKCLLHRYLYFDELNISIIDGKVFIERSLSR